MTRMQATTTTTTATANGMLHAPLLSDQELLDVLSQIDQDSGFAPDKSVAVQLQHEGASTVALALADGWNAVEMLDEVDGVFSAGHTDDDFASLIDTLSHSDEAESVASSPPQQQRTITVAPSAKPRRKRRKHELDHLRALATALEAKLASIKKKSENTTTSGSAQQHFWKRIADQLLVDKQRAVGENARLRDVLRDQIKVVKSLQRSLAKSPDLTKLGIFPPDRTTALASTAAVSSKEIYGTMFRSIASSYDGMDAVFAQANMPRPSATHEARKVNMEMRTEGDVSVMCMQVVETRVLPFSFLLIGDAAWTYLTSTNEAERRMGFHREFYPDGDELYGECKLNCSTGVVKLSGHVAMRRYLEQNRLKFVWECVGTCQSDPYATKVVQMSEKGWCLFEPSEDDPLHSTVFRTCVHFTPRPVGEPQVISASPIDVGITTELVLGVYEKTIGHIYNAVLGSLLEGLRVATKA